MVFTDSCKTNGTRLEIKTSACETADTNMIYSERPYPENFYRKCEIASCYTSQHRLRLSERACLTTDSFGSHSSVSFASKHNKSTVRIARLLKKLIAFQSRPVVIKTAIMKPGYFFYIFKRYGPEANSTGWGNRINNLIADIQLPKKKGVLIL